MYARVVISYGIDHHLVYVPNLFMTKDIVDCCVTGVNSIDNKEWICKICDKSLKRGKYPDFPMQINDVPSKPTVFDVTGRETYSFRIPFMVYKSLLVTIVTNYIIIVPIYLEQISSFSRGIAR